MEPKDVRPQRVWDELRDDSRRSAVAARRPLGGRAGVPAPQECDHVEWEDGLSQYARTAPAWRQTVDLQSRSYRAVIYRVHFACAANQSPLSR